MGGNSSSTAAETEERTNRFIQSAQHGVTVYSKANVDLFVQQFQAIRTTSFAEIKQKLVADLAADKNNLKKFWTRATTMFNKAPSNFRGALKKSDGSDFPDECHIAIICYSMGYGADSVYWKFNEECRDVCEGRIKMSQMSNTSVFLLFRYVMENKGYNKQSEPPVFYRGCTTKYGGHAGGADDLVSFGSFTSTSIKGTTASGFAGFYETHSEFPYEKEYLLSPFQLFTVTKIEQQGEQQMVYLTLY